MLFDVVSTDEQPINEVNEMHENVQNPGKSKLLQYNVFFSNIYFLFTNCLIKLIVYYALYVSHRMLQ